MHHSVELSMCGIRNTSPKRQRGNTLHWPSIASLTLRAGIIPRVNVPCATSKLVRRARVPHTKRGLVPPMALAARLTAALFLLLAFACGGASAQEEFET